MATSTSGPRWNAGSLRRGTSRFGSAIGRSGRRLLQGVLSLVLPVEENVSVERLGDVRSVLLVRPNFRLGNALITSPLAAALRERFPNARIDYLGGEGTLSLLDGLPFDERFAMSRGFVLRPWRFVELFLRLRRRRYDVAIEGALGSFSGGLYTFLSGGRYRVGVPRRNERFLNVRLPATPVGHAYDGPVALSRHLGVRCEDRPVYVVSADEDQQARAQLAALDLLSGSGVVPFVAVFIGGHGAKRWPLERWIELASRLSGAHASVVVFAGPDEVDAIPELRARLGGSVQVVAPLPLRGFAAVLAKASVVVTPDSGPMHLAAALGTPVIAVLANRGSTFFQPRTRLDRSLLEPTVDQVVAAVTGHPRWPLLVAASAESGSAA